MATIDDLWRLWNQDRDELAQNALLAEIGSVGDTNDLPDLLRIVLNDKRLPTAEGASRAIATIMRRQLPADLPRHESAVRVRLPPLTEPELRQNRPRLELDQCWGAVGLCSFHANGYVRELSVHWLATARENDALPLLVLRLNDWVPQIRAAARRAVEACLTASNADALVAALPLVFRLRQLRRAEHGDMSPARSTSSGSLRPSKR